jgi:hypothetical protein
MWLLVTTVCMIMGPGEVECRQEAARPEVSEYDCRIMLAPTAEYMLRQAEEMGAQILFFDARCKRGRVS